MLELISEFTISFSLSVIWYSMVGVTISLSSWLAVAPLPFFPIVNALVTYFPQGHLEHCGGNNGFSIQEFMGDRYQSSFACYITEIQFLVDTVSDKLFSCVNLRVVDLFEPLALPNHQIENLGPLIMSFCLKVITPCDLY